MPRHESLGRNSQARSPREGQKLLVQEDMDAAARESWTDFPDPADGHYRDLAQREYLAARGLAMPLNPQEQAELFAKRQFPRETDNHYRGLACREFLAMYGQARLSTEEEAQLFSKRQFPQDHQSRYRELSRRRFLAKEGICEPLSAAEERILEEAEVVRLLDKMSGSGS